MDFLFNQMCGPGFSPKSDLRSCLWVLDIAKGEDGSVSSLRPQHHTLPTRLRAGAIPQQPGSQQLLGNPSAPGKCLPGSHNP